MLFTVSITFNNGVLQEWSYVMTDVSTETAHSYLVQFTTDGLSTLGNVYKINISYELASGFTLTLFFVDRLRFYF